MTQDWATWAYPWDFWDQGEQVTAEAVRSLGVQQVRLAVSYHRAQVITPRSRRGRLLEIPDGVYFAADPAFYRETPLRPVRVESSVGTLEEPLAACRSAGLSVSAWVVLLNNQTLGERHPEFVIQNAWGDRISFALCPAQPAVAAYAAGLVREVVSRYPVDALELEAWHYHGVGQGRLRTKSALPLDSVEIERTGLCFCSACMSRAAALGIDGPAALRQVRSGVAGDTTELAAYRGMRRQVVQDLVTVLKEAAGSVPVRLFSLAPAVAGPLGIDYEMVAPRVDGMIAACYSLDPKQVQHDAAAARRAVGKQRWLDISLKLAEPDAPRNLQQLALAAAAAQPDSLSLYHYGQSTDDGLQAARRVIGGGADTKGCLP